ncbi:hypothetical protein BU17DRAFT_65819 [Hysterangium stoloniferum]|nr:hypothetical protein BU17DRAFT_65819 [Hysterangium stoloniferum]
MILSALCGGEYLEKLAALEGSDWALEQSGWDEDHDCVEHDVSTPPPTQPMAPKTEYSKDGADPISVDHLASDGRYLDTKYLSYYVEKGGEWRSFGSGGNLGRVRGHCLLTNLLAAKRAMVIINCLVIGVHASLDETIGELGENILEKEPKPEGRVSALNKLKPTFTVEESGLSERARHELHVLVMVPANGIIASNSSNSRLSDILTREAGAKRLGVEGSVISDGRIEHIYSKVRLMMLDYHGEFWGSPLDPGLTILPDQANTVNSGSEKQE